MKNDLSINEITQWNTENLNGLCSLLMTVVDDGASIGFLPPLNREDAGIYWNSTLAPGVRLWVAQYDGEIVGTVQLHLSMKQNGAHRAEIVKMIVHPHHRRLGIARQLMETEEQAAVQERRSLFV